jgi:hypothetical protein
MRKNPGETATIRCHTNQQKLWSNYKGNASSDLGARYFTITPQTAAEIAREAVEQHLPSRRESPPTPGTKS